MTASAKDTAMDLMLSRKDSAQILAQANPPLTGGMLFDVASLIAWTLDVGVTRRQAQVLRSSLASNWEQEAERKGFLRLLHITRSWNIPDSSVGQRLALRQ